MKNTQLFEENERLLIQAFNSQNIEAYDETYEKLDIVRKNIIYMIEGIEKNPEFYMRVMPVLKQERELVSEKDYKEFIHKNEKVLGQNLEQRAYFALLMQEMEQKINRESKKWSPKEDALLASMIAHSDSFEEIYEKFGEYDAKEVKRKYLKARKKLEVVSSSFEKEKKGLIEE